MTSCLLPDVEARKSLGRNDQATPIIDRLEAAQKATGELHVPVQDKPDLVGQFRVAAGPIPGRSRH